MSSPRMADRDRAILERYTDQPSRLPSEARIALERAFGGRPVQLYAHADLDAGLQLRAAWIALGPEHVGIATRDSDTSSDEWRIQVAERARILEVKEAPGLSSNVLTVFGSPDDPPLLQVRYSHRQRRAMEILRFLLDPDEPGDRPVPAVGDDAYADAVAGPIREAQALVAKSERAVLWRLLAYLTPYRWQVTIGMLAAATITGLSLLPAWLAGYIIDEVVRPTSEGALTAEDARRIAYWAGGGDRRVAALEGRRLLGPAAIHVRPWGVRGSGSSHSAV